MSPLCLRASTCSRHLSLRVGDVLKDGNCIDKLRSLVGSRNFSPQKGLVQETAPAKVEKEEPTTTIQIKLRSFERPSLGLPSHMSKIGLPDSRVLYTVLRSPHIDKKSREQFEMRIKKILLVIETRVDELRKKYFWLKRHCILGAQFEILFNCNTHLDKEKLRSLHSSS